ncbi:MAG TPA: ABC transporter permease [Anaerolineae bacterium]|nr:ABC transporter permease [Anaerolineae bacterium]HQI87321.1 ABC transporter permease [Anaerolineae bacterium]
MWQYLFRRFLSMLFTVWVISMLSFALIQLPPGDYVTTLVNQLVATSAGSATISSEYIAQLREMYGFNQPIYVQYFKWIGRILTKGEFGYSFVYKRDAAVMITERLPMSFALSFSSLLLVWAVALPIGIYSAVRQYSLGDYIFSFVGFIGLAVPNFLLALILLFITYKYFDQAMIGLFSQEYASAPWDMAKFIDMLKHLWIPALIIGLGGTAGLIRTMRANLLDELNKPYVETARAKGLAEGRLLWKYPVRHAMNPFISTIGWALPGLIAGDVIVSIVLNLPTSGPVLFNALKAQDMYVAAGFILMLSILTVIGTFVSDVLLAVLDPRIRLQ